MHNQVTFVIQKSECIFSEKTAVLKSVKVRLQEQIFSTFISSLPFTHLD